MTEQNQDNYIIPFKKLSREELQALGEELLKEPDAKPDSAVISSTAPDLKGFIYVPSIGIYLAKERTFQNKKWHQCHEELSKKNAFMPTVKHFVEFIKYLKQGYPNRKEADQILDDILTVREPWRAEWLDADFKMINDELHINYDYRMKSGKLAYGKQEQLKDWLDEDRTPGIDMEDWLKNSNQWGLPRANAKQGSLHYYCPDKDNNSVAGFGADSDWSGLDCIGGILAVGMPLSGYVRPAKRAECSENDLCEVIKKNKPCYSCPRQQ